MATVTFFLSAALHRIPAAASARHFVLAASDSLLNKRIKSTNSCFKRFHCSDWWWRAFLQTQHTFVIIRTQQMQKDSQKRSKQVEMTLRGEVMHERSYSESASLLDPSNRSFWRTAAWTAASTPHGPPCSQQHNTLFLLSCGSNTSIHTLTHSYTLTVVYFIQVHFIQVNELL